MRLNCLSISVQSTIFIGEVIESDVQNDKSCMTYDYYQQVKKGTTPRTAPSYIEEKSQPAEKLAGYRCSVCNWRYDPVEGYPDGGIAPGIPFEKLPDTWVCPVCGASKDQFRKED